MSTRFLRGLAVMFGVVGAALGDVPTYRVDYLGAGWTGTAMNESGAVCGHYSPDGTRLLAGVSRGGAPFVELPLPAGMQSCRANDINDDGVIVGAVCPNQYVISQPIAALWRPAGEGYEVEVLGLLPGHPYSAAYAINNVGDVIGGAGFFGWNLGTGVRFTDAGPVPLPNGFIGYDINDSRVLVSGNRLLDLDTESETVIPLPPGNWQGMVSAGINQNSDICGYVAGFSGCSTFPVRYRHAAGWEFLGGCATTTSATALNDHGDALLYYYTTTAGVDFVGDGYHMLDTLIDPSQGLWFVMWGGANAINNAHQIVAGVRQGLNGPIGTALLTPMSLSISGDLNCDGLVTVSDIAGFVLALTDPDAYAQQFPQCDLLRGDMNLDGTVTVSDIGYFVAVLTA